MSWCGVTKLPKSFKRLRNLLHLDLSHCYIEKGLGAALHGLTALQYLDMSNLMYPYASEVSEEEKRRMAVTMRSFTNLKVLKLGWFRHDLNLGSCNNLNFIGILTNLEHLDLSSNNFEYLPKSIGNIKRLHTLNLKDCWKLESLPESIGCATGLKSVLLDGCPNELMDRATSLLHYLLTLPLFKVRGDDVSAHSNLHVLEGENVVDELHIVSLENVRLLEEAQRLNLLTKQNLLNLKLVWTWKSNADRHLEDEDLLGQLVPPMSLKVLSLEGYSSPSFPGWLMAISRHLPNLTSIELKYLGTCSNLPALGQLPYLQSLHLCGIDKVSNIDGGICGGKGANQVISSLEELQTSSHRCNSTPTTTSLAISTTSQHQMNSIPSAGVHR
uniref:R13L1/DRL21-like LRR repeat region domain-containing protein n=1 Tax=Setaria italica TaxID=4555 RepID=K3ZZ98_SETIT